MPETLRFHDGQAYLEVSNEDPFPVKVVRDVESANIHVNTTIEPQNSVSATLVELLAPANPRRRSVMLMNLTGTQIVYLGTVVGLTSTTARSVLGASLGSTVTIFAKDAIYGLSATSAQSVGVWEEEYSGG